MSALKIKIVILLLLLPAIFAVASGAEVAVCTEGSSQVHPDVDGNYVVWEDHRTTDSRIYLYNIASGTAAPISPSLPVGTTEIKPAISGDKVVYVQASNSPSSPAYAIVLYSIAAKTRTVIRSSEYLLDDPDVYSDLLGGVAVVWTAYEHQPSDIYPVPPMDVWQYTKGSDRALPTTSQVSHGGLDGAARIYGNKIVWVHYTHVYGDEETYGWATSVYTRIGSTGTPTLLSTTSDGDRNSGPDISGDRVVWGDTPGTYPLRTKVLLSNLPPTSQDPTTLRPVPSVTPNPDKSYEAPAISGTTVIYVDVQESVSKNTLRVMELGSSVDYSLSPSTYVKYPRISHDTVVWQDDRTGNPDIYLAKISQMPTAAFSAAPVSGSSPLTVQFTDASTGSPTSWAWTFGDGGTSTARNPSHTYAAAGTYTVALTVRNAEGQSDAETKAGMITVRPPSLAVTSITPNTGVKGTRVSITNLAGTGFQAGATVKLYRAATLLSQAREIPAERVAVVSPTKITCQFVLPDDVISGYSVLGTWAVVVTNPDTGRAALPDGFRIVSPSPAAFRFAPAPLTLQLGATTSTTLYLDNLAAGLSGFNVTLSLSDPTVGEIVGVTLPRWGLTQKSRVPADTVWISAVDTTNIVGAGGNALIGTVDVRGDKIGQTELRVTLAKVDDEVGNPVVPLMTSCIVNVTPRITPQPTQTPGVILVPGGAGIPIDTDADGKYDDVNGNSRRDFADVVLYFNQMAWITANEPVSLLDFNANSRIDFADVVWLFTHL